MPRLSLTLALLAGSLALAPVPSLAAAALPNGAGPPLAVQDFEFLELVPSEEALGSEEGGKQLLRDTLARIAVEVELRGATEAAAEAELLAVARFLKGSAYDPEVPPLDVLDLFWAQNATTRQAAGLQPLDREDPQVLQVLGARLGFDPQRLAPVRRQSDFFVPRPAEQASSQPALTEEEIEAYLAANFEPTPSAVRDLVYATIGADTARIEALGVRASGTLAQLVLADLENPFVRPLDPEDLSGYDLPKQDPLLILGRVDPVAARRLVDAHLDRGGLGWGARILSLYAQQPSYWPNSQEQLELAERWLVRLLDWPQLHPQLSPKVSGFYDNDVAGSANLIDSGRLSRELLQFPSDDPMLRAAIGEASRGQDFHPAIAQLARHVGTNPTYDQPYAIMTASRAPEPSWILQTAGSPNWNVSRALLKAIQTENVQAATSAAERTAAVAAVMAVIATDRPNLAAYIKEVFQSGVVHLTPALVAALLADPDPRVSFGILAPLPPADPAAVFEEALRLLPESSSNTFWTEFTMLDWVQELLARPEGRAVLASSLISESSLPRERRLDAFSDFSSNSAYLALYECDRREAAEEALADALLMLGPSPPMEVELVEWLLDTGAGLGQEYMDGVYRLLNSGMGATAMGFAADQGRSALARVVAMRAVVEDASARGGPLNEEEGRVLREILLLPGAAEIADVDNEENWVAWLADELRNVRVGEEPARTALLADIDFVRQLDSAVLGALTVTGVDSTNAPVLLKRLAEDLHGFRRSNWIWSALKGVPHTPEVRADILVVLDRGVQSYKAMEVLAATGDPSLLPRFVAVFEGVPAATSVVRQRAIEGLGRIGTLESAQALRELQRSARLTAEEDAIVRRELEQIAKRIEQDRFWDGLASGLPGRDEAAARLLEQLDPANPAAMRAAAAKALGALGAVTLQPKLIELLGDASEEVRVAAQEALDLIALQVRRDLEQDD